MNTDKVEKAKQALSALQEQLFDALALLVCLEGALEGGGHYDMARAAGVIGTRVSHVAESFEEVLA